MKAMTHCCQTSENLERREKGRGRYGGKEEGKERGEEVLLVKQGT